MFGLIAQSPRHHLSPILDGGGGGDFGGGDFGGGGGYTAPVTGTTTTAPQVSQTGFDTSPASIQAAVARGNTQGDILSAYQTFLTGAPVGRGGQYAVSAQSRYGYASIRDAAAAYLDAAGLRRLAETLTVKKALDPEENPDDSGVVTNPNPVGKGDPFKTIDDLVSVFERVFAVPSSTDTPAPVVVVGDTTEGKKGGSNLGVILLVLALGAGAFYWFYLRKKGNG